MYNSAVQRNHVQLSWPQRATFVTVDITAPSLPTFQTLNTSSSPCGNMPYNSTAALRRGHRKIILSALRPLWILSRLLSHQERWWFRSLQLTTKWEVTSVFKSTYLWLPPQFSICSLFLTASEVGDWSGWAGSFSSQTTQVWIPALLHGWLRASYD